MLGYHVPKEAFVASATAIALLVDVARLPVYLETQGNEIARLWPEVFLATTAVMVGTLIGRRLLGHLSEALFRRMVALLLLGLGGYMLLGR